MIIFGEINCLYLLIFLFCAFAIFGLHLLFWKCIFYFWVAFTMKMPNYAKLIFIVHSKHHNFDLITDNIFQISKQKNLGGYSTQITFVIFYRFCNLYTQKCLTQRISSLHITTVENLVENEKQFCCCCHCVFCFYLLISENLYSRKKMGIKPNE